MIKINIFPQTLERAREARARGIEIFVVAVGEGVDMNEVNGMASDPDSEHVIRYSTGGDPNEAANDLLDLLCA